MVANNIFPGAGAVLALLSENDPAFIKPTLLKIGFYHIDGSNNVEVWVNNTATT